MLKSAHSLFHSSLSSLLSPPTLFHFQNSRADQTKVNKDTKMDTTEPAPKTPKKRGATASANDESAQPTKKRSPTKKATAASNVEANTNGAATEPITPTPKKRASPKKKIVASANANAETEDGEKNGETEGPEPVTPKKGKRAPAKGKSTKANDESADTTDKSISPTKGNGEIEGTTVNNTPRKRQAPKKELAAPRGIPSSWDNADHADRMMVMMKEKGESWTEIRAAWKEVTGQETASRYVRFTHPPTHPLINKSPTNTHLRLAARYQTATTASKST